MSRLAGRAGPLQKAKRKGISRRVETPPSHKIKHPGPDDRSTHPSSRSTKILRASPVPREIRPRSPSFPLRPKLKIYKCTSNSISPSALIFAFVFYDSQAQTAEWRTSLLQTLCASVVRRARQRYSYIRPGVSDCFCFWCSAVGLGTDEARRGEVRSGMEWRDGPAAAGRLGNGCMKCLSRELRR